MFVVCTSSKARDFAKTVIFKFKPGRLKDGVGEASSAGGAKSRQPLMASPMPRQAGDTVGRRMPMASPGLSPVPRTSFHGGGTASRLSVQSRIAMFDGSRNDEGMGSKGSGQHVRNLYPSFSADSKELPVTSFSSRRAPPAALWSDSDRRLSAPGPPSPSLSPTQSPMGSHASATVSDTDNGQTGYFDSMRA